MKLFITISATVITATSFALSKPAGICLHSYSPLAPADKVECFEYVKFEKISEGYRFFLDPTGSTIVPKIRFRGVIDYVVGLTPTHPKFNEVLELYVKTTTESPSTRRYLNERVKIMRATLANFEAAKQHDANASKIKLAGATYSGAKFNAFREGFLTISHNSGSAKIDIDNISEAEWGAFQKVDSEASKVKVVTVQGNRLWDAKFGGLTLDGVKIEHAKGISTLAFDALNAADKMMIASLSDGSWRLAPPGFHGASKDGETYDELICYDGKLRNKVKLGKRMNDQISITTNQGESSIPIKDAFELPGKSKADQTRVGNWIDELVEEGFTAAEPSTNRRVVEFSRAKELLVTNVSVRILQVLNEGVLASEFVGLLHSGENEVESTKSVSTIHPITGEAVTRILDQTTKRVAVTEPVRDDLCFIVGNSSTLTEGQVVKVAKMTLEGKYEYVDVRGAKRTVRKYSVK